MKPHAKPVTRLLAMAILSCGVSLGAEQQVAPAMAGGVRASDQKSATGTPREYPAGTRGEELYNASCVVCHGQRAMGGIGPKLAGNPVLSNDQAFWKIVHEGRHVMPPLKGVVTDEQIMDIRAWLKSLP